MSKRSVFTTITPLPAGITRETVLEFLHNHSEMIDLNPLVIDRYPTEPPSNATVEEKSCTWYTLKDRVSYLPGGLMTGEVKYNACFHDLNTGVQTHIYAPLGLDIKEKWTVGGSLPHEPRIPQELGLNIPKDGLYMREDCEMRCNIFMTSFVKGTLKRAHAVLVDRLVAKAGLEEVKLAQSRMSMSSSSVSTGSACSGNVSPGLPGPGVANFPFDTFAAPHSDSKSLLSMYDTTPPRYQNQPYSSRLHCGYAELDNAKARPPPIQEHAQVPEEQKKETASWPVMLPTQSFEPAFQVSGFYAPERREYVPYQADQQRQQPQVLRRSLSASQTQRATFVSMPMPPMPPRKPKQYAMYIASPTKELTPQDIHPALRPRPQEDLSHGLPQGIAELEG